MIFVLGLFGLIIGSFLNVLIYRLNVLGTPKFWEGRSFCPSCKHALAWSDNIPLLSFLGLHGRCRYCREPISWQYPTVEVVTAVTSAVMWIYLGDISLIAKLFYYVVAYSLIVIFFSDLIYGLIPDEMIIMGSLGAVIYNWKFAGYNFLLNLLIGGLAGLGFLTIVLVTRFRGMGLGDVKLAVLIGLLLGWPAALVGIWSAFLLGGLAALALLGLKKVRLSGTIALGPFLVMGVLIAALWTKPILAYLGF